MQQRFMLRLGPMCSFLYGTLGSIDNTRRDRTIVPWPALALMIKRTDSAIVVVVLSTATLIVCLTLLLTGAI